MFVFISLAFCLTLSSVFAACPDKWVDASEYDMGKLKLRRHPKINGFSRVSAAARQGTEPQAAQLGSLQ